MKKKLLAMALCATVVFANINAFAILEEANEPESDKIVFADDFESYTVGDSITSIKGSDGKTNSEDILACKEESEEPQNETTFAEINKGAKLGVVFGDDATVKSGKLVLEFDGKLAAGNLWFSLLYSGSLGTRGKWFAGSDTSGLCTITANANIPGSTADGYQRFTDADGNDILYNRNGWSHYKFVIDMEQNTVAPYMDDKEGIPVGEYTYIKGQSIGGIGIYNASGGSRYIDNIKIYLEADKQITYTTHIYQDDMNGYIVGEAIANNKDKTDGDANYGYWSSNPESNPEDFKAVKKADALCANATDASKIETAEPEDPDNIVAEIGNKTVIQYDLPYAVSDEIICVSLDMLTGNGGFGIGIRQEGDSALNAKCPMWVHRNAVRTYFLKPGETSYSSSDSTRYYYSTMTMYKKYQWYKTKLYINAKTGDCWMDINGNVSEIKNLDYIGTDNTKANAVNKPITAIVFYNSRATSVFDDRCYIDNLEITGLSAGNSVVGTVNGTNKIRIEFKDSLDASTVDSSNVSVTKGGLAVEVSDITVDDKNPRYMVIKFDDVLAIGDTYNIEISDNIKYSDGNTVISGNYDVEIAESAFGISAEFADTSYEAYSEFTAKYTVESTELEAKTIRFVVAAYKEGKLIYVKHKLIDVGECFYGAKTFNVECTLPVDADTLKAFAWSGNLAPYIGCEIAQKPME